KTFPLRNEKRSLRKRSLRCALGGAKNLRNASVFPASIGSSSGIDLALCGGPGEKKKVRALNELPRRRVIRVCLRCGVPGPPAGARSSLFRARSRASDGSLSAGRARPAARGEGRLARLALRRVLRAVLLRAAVRLHYAIDVCRSGDLGAAQLRQVHPVFPASGRVSVHASTAQGSTRDPADDPAPAKPARRVPALRAVRR